LKTKSAKSWAEVSAIEALEDKIGEELGRSSAIEALEDKIGEELGGNVRNRGS
jgi:hypothetical protein